MSNSQIAAEFGGWVPIFMKGGKDPKALYDKHWQDMGIMQEFLMALLYKEKSSGRNNYPKDIINTMIGKLARVKGELQNNYGTDKTPEWKDLKLIPELLDLSMDLEVAYKRMD